MAASERNPYKRGWYWRRVRRVNHRRLIFLDESAVNTAMTPTHGRAPRGARVHDAAPRNYGEQTSIVGALSFGRGPLAVMTLTGAVDTLAFDAYLARVLAPRLRKGDVVVLDNLAGDEVGRAGAAGVTKLRRRLYVVRHGLLSEPL